MQQPSNYDLCNHSFLVTVNILFSLRKHIRFLVRYWYGCVGAPGQQTRSRLKNGKTYQVKNQIIVKKESHLFYFLLLFKQKVKKICRSLSSRRPKNQQVLCKFHVLDLQIKNFYDEPSPKKSIKTSEHAIPTPKTPIIAHFELPPTHQPGC